MGYCKADGTVPAHYNPAALSGSQSKAIFVYFEKIFAAAKTK